MQANKVFSRIVKRRGSNISLGALTIVASLAVSGSYAQGPGSLPFTQTYRRPSVSAYQQLSNVAMNPQQQTTMYQQFVQPLQQQQQTIIEQMSLNRKLGNVQQQVQTLDRTSRERMIDATIRPTGHASTYMNYSHFYPVPRR